MVSRALFIFILSFFAKTCFASPWIFPGDTRTRHHLQFLADSGVIHLPMTTWPLAWVNVRHSLEHISISGLTEAELWSVKYLKHELTKAMDPFYGETRSYLSDKPSVLGTFNAAARERREAHAGLIYTHDSFAARINTVFTNSQIDQQRIRFDGSYLATLIGNWAIGIGAIDRWWGPGWLGSSILSNNARPAPGLFIQRNQTHASKFPLLQWLGKWQFTTFINQLQDDNSPIDKPLMWGGRFSIMPQRNLELSLSRTAIWGGKGQSEGTAAFWRVLKHERDISDSQADNHYQSSIDIRYGRQIKNLSISMFGQASGREKAFLSRQYTIGVAGIELAGLWNDTHHRFTLEASNSVADFHKDEQLTNTAYEHNDYMQGYRYRSRPLGLSSDNDSEVLSVSGQHYFVNGKHLQWRLIKANINKDGSHATTTQGNLLESEPTKAESLQVSYSIPTTENLMIELGGQFLSNSFELQGEQVGSSANITLHHHW